MNGSAAITAEKKKKKHLKLKRAETEVCPCAPLYRYIYVGPVNETRITTVHCSMTMRKGENGFKSDEGGFYHASQI